jgi:hypothetical protein
MKNILYLCVLLYVLPVNANDAISAFLLKAQTEVAPAAFDESTATVNVLGGWLESAQFRFNASVDNKFAFDDHAQAYEIRIKPKAWGQRAAENTLLKLHSNQKNHQYNQQLNIALQKRYIKLVTYLEQRHATHYLLQRIQLLSQEQNLMRSRVSTQQFNAEKFLDIAAILQQAKDMADLNISRLQALQKQLQLPLESAENLLHNPDTQWLINIDELHNNLSGMKAIHQSALDIQAAQLKVKMLQAESQLTKAEQQLGINLLSFEYKDSRNDSMGFLLGVNIPLGTRFNRAKNKYQLYGAQAQLRASLASLKQNMHDIQLNINWLAEEQALIHKHMTRLEKQLQKEYIQSNSILMLGLRKDLLEQNKKSIDTRYKAIKLYLRYLALSGQLVQLPLRNWLQQGTPELVANLENE